MSRWSDMSDEELVRQIDLQPAHIQQAAIAELHRRQGVKLHGEIGNVKQEVTTLHTDLSKVQGQLNTLKESHRIHLWILAIAIATAIFAAIAAIDAVLKWVHAD